MIGLVMMEVMTLSGHLSNINEIRPTLSIDIDSTYDHNDKHLDIHIHM